MKLDNSEKIKKFMSFDSKDDFYFVTLLKRKKDFTNWNMNCNNIPVKNYYIKSLEDFDKKIPMIQEICEATNARAYFWLNKRSFKKCSMKLISAVATNIETENYEGNKGAWDSVCGSYSNDKNKKWIFDIDDPERIIPIEALIDSLNKILVEIQPIDVKNKIMDVIPTLNGFHIITSPFDIQSFHKLYKERYNAQIPSEEVKKDAPTLLYYNNKLGE